MTESYTLYHKTVPVLKFLVNEKGYVTEIQEIINEKHVPVQFLENGKLNTSDNYYALIDKMLIWMASRNIPQSRKNLPEILSAFGTNSTDELAKKAFYMSLSDHYWAVPSEINADWSKLNFFENDFSDDTGSILLGNRLPSLKKINFHTPNCTSQGELAKAWKIIENERILIKGGSSPFQQEPLNEVLASEIFHRLKIPSVKYLIALHKNKPYSLCKNFLDKNHELITAGELCEDLKDFVTGKVDYDKFKDRCTKMNTGYNEIFIGKMFLVDCLIANSDRHLNNFGFIRNADTLKWEGLAPVYDSGNSMFKDLSLYELKEQFNLKSISSSSKPFASIHEIQLSMLPMKEVYRNTDLTVLNGIENFYRKILEENSSPDFISEERKDILANILKQRLELIKDLAVNKKEGIFLNDKKNPSSCKKNDEIADQISDLLKQNHNNTKKTNVNHKPNDNWDIT